MDFFLFLSPISVVAEKKMEKYFYFLTETVQLRPELFSFSGNTSRQILKFIIGIGLMVLPCPQTDLDTPFKKLSYKKLVLYKFYFSVYILS